MVMYITGEAKYIMGKFRLIQKKSYVTQLMKTAPPSIARNLGGHQNSIVASENSNLTNTGKNSLV